MRRHAGARSLTSVVAAAGGAHRGRRHPQLPAPSLSFIWTLQQSLLSLGAPALPPRSQSPVLDKARYHAGLLPTWPSPKMETLRPWSSPSPAVSLHGLLDRDSNVFLALHCLIDFPYSSRFVVGWCPQHVCVNAWAVRSTFVWLWRNWAERFRKTRGVALLVLNNRS
jgi:hypothetical protein